ncbi:hypothetical protein Tco_1207464, partial [Tanacetum coccineum]
SELGSELTFLAGSELKTSELKTSEYSELQVFEDLYTSELGKETLPIVFLASELSSLYPASYRIGTIRDTLAEGTKGAQQLSPERAQVYSDLSPEDKDRFVTAVKLNRGLRDSNYDQLYAYLKQHEAHTNENKMISREWVTLDEEQLLFIAGGQDNAVDEVVDEKPVQDLALNVDNVFQAEDCDAFDFDVDEAPTAQTMFMANLSSANPVYNEASLSYDSDILSEV